VFNALKSPVDSRDHFDVTPRVPVAISNPYLKWVDKEDQLFSYQKSRLALELGCTSVPPYPFFASILTGFVQSENGHDRL
jgi:hypothetical protein